MSLKGDVVEEQESAGPAIALEQLRGKKEASLMGRCFQKVDSQNRKERWLNRAEQWEMMNLYPSTPNLGQQAARTKLVPEEPW